MDGGMTGFNPGLLKSQIDNFVSSARCAGIDIGVAYKNFIDELSYCWASPKAVQFWTDMTPKYEDALWKLQLLIDETAQNMVNAYNYAAQANGAGTTSYENEGGVGFDCGKLLDQRDGVVGMNIIEVRDVVLPAFQNEVKLAVDELKNLPKSIALYDDENGQQHYFSVNVDDIIQKVEENIETIVSEINGAIETETDNVLLAKQNAIESLAN